MALFGYASILHTFQRSNLLRLPTQWKGRGENQLLLVSKATSELTSVFSVNSDVTACLPYERIAFPSNSELTECDPAIHYFMALSSG